MILMAVCYLRLNPILKILLKNCFSFLCAFSFVLNLMLLILETKLLRISLVDKSPFSQLFLEKFLELDSHIRKKRVGFFFSL